MPHLGVVFGLGAHHESRGVAQADDRQVVGVAQLDESRGLVRCVGVDGSSEVCGVVRDHPDGSSLDAHQHREDADAEFGPQFQHRSDVGETVDGAAHVVDAGALLGYHVAKHGVVVAFPFRERSLEVRQVLLGYRDGCFLVGHAHVDDPVGDLDPDRSDVGRLHDSESAALDHRGAGHSDVAVLGRNDHVAATEQCGVAGEAVPGGDSYERNETRQTCEPRERHAVETGDAR